MKRVYKNENGVISNVRYEDDDYKCQKNEKELAYSDDLMGGIVNVNSNNIAEQYAAINFFVSDTIKNGHDYDSFEETRAWYDDDEFRIEAKAVNAWCRQCFKIQADIKSGVKQYDSVEAVIADLPKYEILA
ncbi:MAG: hypothetical protein RL755_16 [Pseudomonadota bacterium]|jgi:hypothetical protein